MNVMTVVIDELGRRQTKAELIERRKAQRPRDGARSDAGV